MAPDSAHPPVLAFGEIRCLHSGFCGTKASGWPPESLEGSSRSLEPMHHVMLRFSLEG